METKVCTKCGRELPLSDFYSDRSKKDGKAGECKHCCKEYREKNKEYHKEYHKEYYENNKEKIKENSKKYYENNKERRKEYQKEYNIKYHIKNKEYYNKYRKNKLKEDELFAVSVRCRHRIYHFIQKRGYKKTSKTFEMIGCTPEQLLEHLHKTWYDNYGTEYNGEPVHIDHIIPLSSAETEEDVVRLCHYTNLQYLKPEDNLAKSDNFDYDFLCNITT